MLEDLQLRNLSPHTQRAYVEHVARLARFCGRSPAHLGPEDIHTYMLHLTHARHLAPSTIIVAVAALRSTGVSWRACPACHHGHMRVIDDLPRACATIPILDSS
jgi:hypothetical protein